MEHFFLVILAFLALLACFDLFVGVSNDASNFLNSALGCRIATLLFVLDTKPKATCAINI